MYSTVCTYINVATIPSSTYPHIGENENAPSNQNICDRECGPHSTCCHIWQPVHTFSTPKCGPEQHLLLDRGIAGDGILYGLPCKNIISISTKGSNSVKYYCYDMSQVYDFVCMYICTSTVVPYSSNLVHMLQCDVLVRLDLQSGKILSIFSPFCKSNRTKTPHCGVCYSNMKVR